MSEGVSEPEPAVAGTPRRKRRLLMALSVAVALVVAAGTGAFLILRKLAEGEVSAQALGDTSTLADPSVVDNLVANRQG